MTSTTFFFVFIPILAIILLAINLIFAPHNPYQEKESTFECGFHSFLGQNRTQFAISFFIFALLFLLFDLEILLVYPYVVSAYANDIYGLVVMLIFFLALTLGFVFEFGKGALKIDSRQMLTVIYRNSASTLSHHSGFKSVSSSLFKYFTLERIIVGLISLTLIALLRFVIYGGLFTNPLSLVEAFTIGVPAIFIKLGIQGLVDWVFQDLGIKAWLLDIFNGPSAKANTLNTGYSTNSNSSYDINEKSWKYLYNNKGSIDGEVDNKSASPAEAGLSESASPAEASAEPSELYDDVPSLSSGKEPSPSESPSPSILVAIDGKTITLPRLLKLIKVNTEATELTETCIKEYRAMQTLCDRAITIIDREPRSLSMDEMKTLNDATRLALDGRVNEEIGLRTQLDRQREGYSYSEGLYKAKLEEARRLETFYDRQLKLVYDKLKIAEETSSSSAQLSLSRAVASLSRTETSLSSEVPFSWGQLKLAYLKAKLAEEAASSSAQASSSSAQASSSSTQPSAGESSRPSKQPSTFMDDQVEGKGKGIAEGESNPASEHEYEGKGKGKLH